MPAVAREMTASEARQFVVGHLFSYKCFDGTRGVARVHRDGSVVGSIRFQSGGLTRYTALLPDTLRVEGGRVCMSLRGTVQSCFNLERTDANSFHGSVAGLSFAYCDFTLVTRTNILHSGPPLQLRSPPPLHTNK
jgi:hypothetical protein